ncbi:TIP41-like protein [Selaginella moellendorffii]|uniref:TIP41-like protein n=1 Tax=Selaginella moellendorffii TaxID=88036 RepID=UPI000D1CA055|nr:TIP41-like protein [Selaginella moellendorffii]|eukprot:XP_002962435.2 TIP41-like protein [Selaginella moellendorffii]
MGSDEDAARLKAAMESSGAELICDPPQVRGIRVAGWRIRSTKRAILNAEQIERWEAKLGTRHLPEMVFGGNELELVHEASGIAISFNAFDALAGWKRENLPPVEVPAAAKWKMRCNPNEQLIMDYDYTFTTPYCGSERLVLEQEQADKESSLATLEWKSCDTRIDLIRLQVKDPILFYDEVILYEDELSDNGISFLSVKVRVMPNCWFLLLRFWLRVDGVLMRLRDTRMYSGFQSDPREFPDIIRERSQREETFRALLLKGQLEPSLYQDPNIVGDRLPIRDHHHEKLHKRPRFSAIELNGQDERGTEKP